MNCQVYRTYRLHHNIICFYENQNENRLRVSYNRVLHTVLFDIKRLKGIIKKIIIIQNLPFQFSTKNVRVHIIVRISLNGHRLRILSFENGVTGHNF